MSVCRRSPRRLAWLVQMLAIASTTSAVSLQDFQAISIAQVPSLSCLSAYGSTILGCARSDFQDGVQCSESCAQGIMQSQANIMTACRGVGVNDTSLLGLTLLGGLVDALCPNFLTTSVTPTGTPTTALTFASSTLMLTMSTAESQTGLLSETDMPVVSTAPTDTAATAATSPTNPGSGATKTNGGGGSPFGGSSGGGSPIDTVFPSSSERALPVGVSMGTALVAALIVMFIMV
ncbi:hypothetical protein F4861DRAFT_489068 [Xylaria intraflava]|nr:hypothetical protein F4861DRAFT_489068 [Xylaria intraflava]